MTIAYNEAAPVQGPSFPIEGESYAPLVNKTEDGKVYAHSYQTINASPEDLYQYWHTVRAIPTWQEYVVSVTPVSDTVSHWVMGDPDDSDGKRVEFDSELYENEPGKKLAWRSISGDVDQSGVVTFTPHPSGRGTIVLLQETIKVPGGALGNAAAALAKRGPKQIVIENLRHFKQMVETGSIPSVVGQPHGPRGVSGSIKEWMYGENNPTPVGTSEQTAVHNDSTEKA